MIRILLVQISLLVKEKIKNILPLVSQEKNNYSRKYMKTQE